MGRWKWNKYYRLSFAMQLMFCYYLGLRPNSVRLIEIKHIDFVKKELFIPACNFKTRDDFTFPLPEFLYSALIKYLKVRCKFFNKNSILFPSRTRRFQDRASLSARARKVLRESGISKLSFIDKAGFRRMSKNLYSLRHTLGSNVWEKTGDIKKVMLVLGHKDIRSSLRYVHAADNEKRKEVFAKIYKEDKTLFY